MLHTHSIQVHDEAGRVDVILDDEQETSYGYSDENSRRFARSLAESRARSLSDDLHCRWQKDY